MIFNFLDVKIAEFSFKWNHLGKITSTLVNFQNTMKHVQIHIAILAGFGSKSMTLGIVPKLISRMNS